MKLQLSRPYRLLDREEERPEDPRLRLLGLDRCTDGREAERDGRPMFDLLDDRGVERIVEVEPNVDPLERCEGLTLRRLADGLDLLVERVRPSRGVDCLGLEGVRKIRGPEDREEFRVPRPSGRCPRDPPARPRSGWTRGAEEITPVRLLELALELPLDRASGRSACARLGLTLMMLGPPRRLPVGAPPCCSSPPLKILGEVLPALPALDVVVPEKLGRVVGTPRRLEAALWAAPARIGLTVRDPEATAEPPLTRTFRPPRTGLPRSLGSPSRNLPAMARVGVTRRSSREPLPKSLSLTTFRPLPGFRGFHRLINV